MHSLTKVHQQALKQTLYYLKGTYHCGLLFQAYPNFNLVGYIDVDQASCANYCRSTSGYCIFFGSSLVSWAFSKQCVVSHSSAEAKYQSVANGAIKLAQLRSVLVELCISMDQVPLIFCDNTNANHKSSKLVLNACTKHMEIGYNFVQEKIMCNLLQVKFTPSTDQLANCKAKVLPTKDFLANRSKLIVLTRPLSLRRAIETNG